MTKESYLRQHPDLKAYGPFIRPALARRIGIDHKFIIFPPHVDQLSDYELKRLNTMHTNKQRLLELGLIADPFNPHFLLGQKWKLKKDVMIQLAKGAIGRVARRSGLKARMSRRVSARRTIRNSPEFKAWREHVKYMPDNSGYLKALEEFENTRQKMEEDKLLSSATLEELMELIGD